MSKPTNESREDDVPEVGWLGDVGLGMGVGTGIDGGRVGSGNGAVEGESRDQIEKTMRKENRWRRAWILSQGRRAVRKWLEESKEGGQ